MSACSDLQQQCLELLSELKTNQTTLKQAIPDHPDAGLSTIDKNLETRLQGQKPDYARQKLRSIMKTSNGEGRKGFGDSEKDNVADNRDFTSIKPSNASSSRGEKSSKLTQGQFNAERKNLTENKSSRLN